MRNARQYDIRRSDGRVARFGIPAGRHRSRPKTHLQVPAGPAWPAPVSGYLEATGRDEQGHLLLTVVPLRATL